MSFFSIILTTYNQIELLKKCLSSVFNQSFKEFELIVIDNNSTDGTSEYLKSIKDERLKILKIHNEGMYVKSRNLGIRNSKTDWIAFIDSDDIWYPEKLKKCYEIIKQNDVDLIYHSVNYLNKKSYSKIIKEKSKKIDIPVEKYLYLNGNIIAQSSVVIKKRKIEQIGYFSEKKEMYGWEDFDAWIRLSIISDKFYFLNTVLGALWFGKSNISNIELMKNNLDSILNFYNSRCLSKYNFEIKSTWWFSYNQSLYYFKNKKFKNALNYCKIIPNCDFRFYIRLLYFKYFSIYMINSSFLIKTIKKIVNIN
jgi:glycosyltransferase involved in cell wall biosynthesis|tara:strand:- start:56 stop:982 length:927 start_codon:yes stop_codon:yes gene_type:complete